MGERERERERWGVDTIMGWGEGFRGPPPTAISNSLALHAEACEPQLVGRT